MAPYFGLSPLAWAFIACGGIAGTFAVLVLFRLLISHRPEHQAYMSPAELRRTIENLRNLNRAVIGFGIATGAALILIAAARALGWL